MRPDEWNSFVLTVKECWHGEWSEAKERGWHVMLDSYPVENLMFALHKIVQNGKPYMPTVPEIIVAMQPETQLPSWAEAYRHIRSNLSGRSSETLPIVKGFIEAAGRDRLRMMPLDDPDWGHEHVKRLKNEWTDFVDRWQARQREGRALEAAGVRKQVTGPQKMNVTELLGIPNTKKLAA